MAFYRDREKPNPQGYALVDVIVFRQKRLHEIELFLPATPMTQVLVQDMKDRALKAQELQEAKALECEEVPLVTVAAKNARLDKRKQDDGFNDRDEMHRRAQEDEIGLSETHRPVYEWDAPLRLIEDKRSADSDLHERNQDVFVKLKKLGHMRRITRGEPERMFDALAKLRDRQPHFSAVIDFVRQHLRLALSQGKPLHLPPVLLLGEPGVGKTHFTQQLAAVLQNPMRRHGFDSATTGSTFVGSEKHWGNTSYGLMFELLCLNEIINPVVLLDEIDKVGEAAHRNAATPLHTLLEPISAGHATDLSVGLTFDASFVTWIATANDASRIPASLRSRFIEFFILPPMGQHALQVARFVADSVFGDMNQPGIEPVPSNITKLLAHLTAREQVQVLKRAYASAFDDNRTCIEIRDVPSSVFTDDDDRDTTGEEKQRTMH